MANSLDPSNNNVFTFNPVMQRYAVVAHYSFDGVCLHVTFQPIAELFSTRAVEANEAWQAAVKRFGNHLQIRILGMFYERVEAVKFAADKRVELEPASRGQRVGRKRVRRTDTGQIWPSVMAAAKAHKISQGAMSNHLNRRKNYATIHGLVFEWVI